MKKIYFAVALFITFQAYTQAPTKVWDSTIGSAGSDIAKTVITTNDGGFVVAGYSISGISGDKTEASRGGSDYWIVKLNSTGQKVWDKTIGGSGNESANLVISTSDGGFVVGGNSTSGISGDKTAASKGGDDYWVVKLNSAGQIVWDKTIGGSGFDVPYGIAAANDGGFVVAGYSSSGISGDKTEASKGSRDYWIIKLNSAGQIVWDKTIGGSGTDFPHAIVAANDGGFVVAGSSPSGISGDKTEASKGINDYWIVKLNSAGQIVWDKTIGGSGFDVPYGIAAANDGGFVVAGDSPSGISGDKTEASRGSEDYWVVKLNSAGQKVWDKTIGGSGGELPTGIAAANDGGFVVAGWSISGISGDKTEASKGGYDYWIVKLNSAGQKVWDKTIGSSGNDYPYTIVATNDDGFVVAGYSPSGISGDKTQASKGGDDYWIVKITGGICPNTLTPTGTITSNQKAANTVITVVGNAGSGTLNIIPNSTNVIYQAGNYVLLNPGFVANNSSIFTAKILAGCN